MPQNPFMLATKTVRCARVARRARARAPANPAPAFFAPGAARVPARPAAPHARSALTPRVLVLCARSRALCVRFRRRRAPAVRRPLRCACLFVSLLSLQR
jgi:hypothetical protein